jgi:hypothetical protein
LSICTEIPAAGTAPVRGCGRYWGLVAGAVGAMADVVGVVAM